MLLIVFLFWERDPCYSSLLVFRREIRVAHRFLFLEWDPCFLCFFFVLGGRTVLLNVFVLGGDSLLLIDFCFGRGILAAYPFLI